MDRVPVESLDDSNTEEREIVAVRTHHYTSGNSQII